MNANTISTIVLQGISSYGLEMLAIIGAVTVVIVGFFVFKMGISHLRWSDGERGVFIGKRFYGSGGGNAGF